MGSVEHVVALGPDLIVLECSRGCHDDVGVVPSEFITHRSSLAAADEKQPKRACEPSGESGLNPWSEALGCNNCLGVPSDEG